MFLGMTPAVVIYDYEIAKELFARDDLAGRPDNFAYRFRMLGKRLGNLNNNLFDNFNAKLASRTFV